MAEMKSKGGASGRTRGGKARRTPTILVEPSIPVTPSRWSVWLPWMVLVAAIAFAAIVRLRLLHIPLERDEGEYAFSGQLLLHGIPPYRDAFNMKLPGVYVAYALIMAVFGQTIGGIHFGFLLWNAATIVLVFLLGKRLFGASAGAAASAAYALLAVSPGVDGTQAHATHFVVLPVLAGCLLLLLARDRGLRPMLLFASGILFGTGILMKQHGAIFALFGAAYLVWVGRKASRPTLILATGAFVAGVATPLGLTGIALAVAGVFSTFWFWTVTYAREYVTETSLSVGLTMFNGAFSHIVGPNLLLWIFAGLGAVMAWWNKADRPAALFATCLLGASFLAVCPGFYFREHYFVLMLPAVALLAGAGVGALERVIGDAKIGGVSLGHIVPGALFALLLLFAVGEQSDFLFRLTPLQATRHLYSLNPFPEAIEVGKYLRAHTKPGERIAVFGSEPEIYFYAGRPAATGYIYTYGMMEPQPYALAMQHEMASQIESARPNYIVQVNASASWLVRPGSQFDIFQWWNKYRAQHYRMVGIAEVVSSEQTDYRWSDVESYDPKSAVSLEVYKRRD